MEISFNEYKEKVVWGNISTNCIVWGWNMEYGSNIDKEIEHREDEVFEEYVWSNMYKLNEKWGSAKENWCGS